MIEKLKNFKFRDKAYNVIKWILFTGVAPTITLIIGLGKLYNFDPTCWYYIIICVIFRCNNRFI